MKGIEKSDPIFAAGYPEAEYRDVAIERDEIVALSYYHFHDRRGWIRGYSACPSSERSGTSSDTAAEVTPKPIALSAG